MNLLVTIILSLLLIQEIQTKATKMNRKLQKKSVQENNVSDNTGELVKKLWIHVLAKNKGRSKESTTIRPKTVATTPSPPESPVVSRERLMSEFKKNVKLPSLDAKYSASPRRRAAVLPRILPDALSAFTVTLQNNILIPKRRFTFLSGFTKGNPGTFIRGSGLDLRLGRYTVPYTALYRFVVNINFHRPLKSVKSQINNGVTARLCIDGECYNNLMKFRTETSSNSKKITINFSGHLYLQKNQYIEIVVENSLSTRILVTSAMFSGYLLGS